MISNAGRQVDEILHPALRRHEQKRRASLGNRIADRITGFAGSMVFVYFHILWFSLWIVVGIEHYPFGLLTMIVSLEAIFLSTFVMISQNRADERRRVLAEHTYENGQLLLKINEQQTLILEELRLHERGGHDEND